MSDDRFCGAHKRSHTLTGADGAAAILHFVVLSLQETLALPTDS